MKVEINEDLVKKQAKRLKEFLTHIGIEIKHGNCIHAVAKSYGFNDWKIMKAFLAKELNSEK